MTTITELIGREEQLSALRKDLDVATSQRGRIVFLSGEAGIGKTRLAGELEGYALTKDILVLHGCCLSPLGSDPYFPFLEALKEYSRRGADAKNGSSVPKEPQTSRQSMPMGLMGIDNIRDKDSTRIENLWRADVGRERDRMYEAISSTILGLSHDRPLLLSLDDLQWVDKSSLELLVHISRNVPDHKVLILCAYRSEEVADTGGEPHPLREAIRRIERERVSDSITLEGLKKGETRRLLAALLGTKDIPDALADVIQDRTSGNPYFIEELVKDLLEQGIINPKDRRWTTRSTLKGIALPATVKDVISRRLSKLDPSALKTLERAAVIGMEFDLEVLKGVSEANEMELVDDIDRLIKSKIILEGPAAGDSDVYRFASATIRESVYEDISKVKRLMLHKKVARAIEERYGEDNEAMVYTLAQHFSQANDKDQSAKYMALAGNMALRTFALEEAVKFYSSALDLLAKAKPTAENLERKEKILLSQGMIHFNIGELNSSLKELGEVLNLSEATGNRKVTATARYWLGRLYERRSEIATADENMSLALSLFKESSDIGGQALVLSFLSFVYLRKGEYAKAMEMATECEELAEKAKALGEQVTATMLRALIYSELGELDNADQWYMRTEMLAIKDADPTKLARLYNNWGDLRMRQWKYADAIPLLEKSLVYGKSSGNFNVLSIIQCNLGECYVHTDQLEKARPHLELAKAMVGKLDDKLFISRMMTVDSIFYRKKKDWKKARELALRSIAMAEKLNIPFAVGEYLMEYGITCANEGVTEEARQLLTRAAGIFKKLGNAKFLERTEKELKAIGG